MVEKSEYRILIQPVPGLSKDRQMELCERYQPAEIYVCVTAEDFDKFVRQMRPPRVAVVPYIALLGEQRGKKPDRADNMTAMKVAIHKKGCTVEEATTRRTSDKHWPALRRDGEEMCGRLSRAAKNPVKAKKGTAPLADSWTDTDIKDMLRIKESRKYPNWRTRRAAIIKLGIKPVPGRTTFIEKLEHIARARGLLE